VINQVSEIIFLLKIISDTNSPFLSSRTSRSEVWRSQALMNQFTPDCSNRCAPPALVEPIYLDVGASNLPAPDRTKKKGPSFDEPFLFVWRARKGETAQMQAPEELGSVERPKPLARAGNPTGAE
jgi:hypothetical protein